MHTFITLLTGITLAISSLFSHSLAVLTPVGSSSTASGIQASDTAVVINSQTTSQSTSSYPVGSAWLTSLPLGDGRYSTTGPKKGYIYVCHVASGGGGAQVNGSWIHGSVWSPAEKLAVQGKVSWPTAKYSMVISGTNRLITTNDLPTDHTTGIFPIQASDPAYQIDRNPSSIVAQNISLSLPAYPSAVASPNCIYGEVGIMTDGVWLFDGFDAEYRDAVAHELQDSYDGHPNQQGYHYHGFIDNYLKTLPVTTVAGYAFDGYPITGPLLPSGKYLTTNDLDECHGMTSTISLDGKQVSTYHYVLTEDFPYSVSCFHGTSHEPKPGGQGGGTATQSAGTAVQGSASLGSGNPPTPPQAAIDACVGKNTNATCTVANGPTGTCVTIGTSFACKPQ